MNAIEAIVMSAVTSETKANGTTRKVTFLLPNDGEHPFAGMVGERLHIVCLKINDDETTESEARSNPPRAASEDAGERAAEPASPASDKRKWNSLPASQQAAIRCGEPEFQRFLGARDVHDAARLVRDRCGVQSRSELNERHSQAATRWDVLEDEFWAWQRNPRAA